MRQRSRFFAPVLWGVLWAGLLFGPAAWGQAEGGGVTLRVVPSASPVSPGDSFSADVVIEGLGELASPALGAFDLVLTYDPALFSLDGYTLGLELGDPALAEAIVGEDVNPGSLGLFEVSLLAPVDLVAQQPGSFLLLTADFQALASGEDTLQLTLNSAPADENGAPLSFAVVDGPVVVGSPLEIPTASEVGLGLLALLLALAALATLRGVRR